MKKITTLFICAIFTISTFAQEKKEPTKKETFDFILNQISQTTEFCYYDNRYYRNCEDADGTAKYLPVSILDYDYDKLYVELKESYIVRGFEYSYYYSFSLEDITSVTQSTNQDGFGIVQFSFKKTFNWKEVRDDGEILRDKDKNSAQITYADILDANRLTKALNHMISLNGNVKKNLFDD